MSASTDPSGFVSNPPTVIVKVQNTSQEALNGQLGVVIQYNADRGRYLVHMVGTQQTVALKPENLVKGNMIDQAKAQYLLLTKDPHVQQEISKYYTLVASTLPPSVKPEHMAAVLGIFLLVGIYFVGFTRIIMLISLIMMVGLLIGPDVLVGDRFQFDLKLIATNFPKRSLTVVEQMIPMAKGRLSDKVAGGIVVAFLLLSARTIFLPPGKPSPAVPPATIPTATSFPTRLSIEEAYKFGFDDATLGKDFGTSLPPKHTSTANSIYDDLQPIDLPQGPSYVYETPKPWYSKIGMWQVMSIINIGRTLVEMGLDPATRTFSAPRVVVNLQQADAMKLGLLGFSVYNVVKVFFWDLEIIV